MQIAARRRLSERALEALDMIPPRIDTALLFSPRAAVTSTFKTGAREWKPAIGAAGIEPERRIYDMRHTFATFAIDALIPTFVIACVMGTSEEMLRRHYGHLLPDTDDLVRERLNAFDAPKSRRLGADWTPRASSSATRRRRLSGGYSAVWPRRPRT